MANGQIRSFLEFANLQMAAEAFLVRLVEEAPPADQIQTRLEQGNFHNNVFTPVQAEHFNSNHDVLAQWRNDPLLPGRTGFSGTLFRHRETEELTLSFRSVEFIDDAIRDATATGRLEVKDLGWAFGQIAEMEAWYTTLRADPELLGDNKFSVTGYSLGGHLATAFCLLRQEEFAANPDANPLINTYTFNGAGTGAVLAPASLTDLVAAFNRISANFSISPEWRSYSIGDQNALLTLAQARIDDITNERIRVGGLTGVRDSFGVLAPAGIQSLLGYQIAALLVGQNTMGSSNFPLPVGANIIPSIPVFATSLITNLVELVGSDGGNLGPSFIANSGIHHGVREEIYIEDQPQVRGNFLSQLAIAGGWRSEGVTLLVNDPQRNDFADTHSLVLLVDSLSLMSVFERLDPAFSLEAAAEIFGAASASRASVVHGTQGTAEGDSLELTLDSLRRLLVGVDAAPTPSSLEGNTWHDVDQRQVFHTNLAALNEAISTSGNLLEGGVRVVSLAQYEPGDMLERVADPDATGAAWRYALANLNPFVLEPTTATILEYESPRYAIFDAALHPNGLTSEYLTDRALFLSWKNAQNILNLPSVNQPYGEAILFDDRASGYRAYVLPAPVTDPAKVQREFDRFNNQGNGRYVVFGDDDSDETIAGRDRSDHLYGGGGIDQLHGAGGADYLEGGEGSDSLYGEEGDRDELFGGVGDDVLDGGPGNDILNGGVDRDLYLYTSGQGADTILDSDGLGTIRVSTAADGVIDLTGGAIAGRNFWKSSDGLFSYTFVHESDGDTLLIVHDNDRLFVKDYKPGKLGIILEGLAPPSPPPSDERLLDGSNDFFEFSASSSGATIKGAGGNDLLLVIPVAAGVPQEGSLVEGGPDSDALSGGSGNDRLFVESRDDLQAFLEGTASVVPGLNHEVVLGNKGDDLIVGGRGNDWLGGGLGKDTVYGGAGDDVISGTGNAYFDHSDSSLPQDRLIFNVHHSALSGEAVVPYLTAARADDRVIRQGLDDQSELDDRDVVFGGAGNDEIWGGYGDDDLVGETGHDSIRGEEGNDIVFGGDGNDELYGDGEQVALSRQGDDFIDGGAGEDVLRGAGGNDFMLGGADRDLLFGGDLDDNLQGQVGDDDLFGGADNDTLAGGPGNDILAGGAGNDTYVIEAGDAGDQIVDDEGSNRVVFGEGVRANKLGVSRTVAGNGIVIQYGTAGDELTIEDGYVNPGQEFEFDDGATLDLRQLLNVADTSPISVTGDGTGDTLLGGSGDDLLTGGSSDVLDGGLGNDTFVVAPATIVKLNAGDGDDLVSGQAWIVIRFDGTVDPRRVLFSEPAPADARVTSERDLVLNYGEEDSVFLTDSPFLIDNSYVFGGGNTLTHVELLDQSGLALQWVGSGSPETVSGTKLDDHMAGEGGSDTLRGLSGDDTLAGGAQKDTLEGGAGDDTLIGGAGSDKLRGGDASDGAGDDRYIFEIGDGTDIVLDNAGDNTIELGAGITLDGVAAELIKGTDGNSYLAVDYAPGETILIQQNFGTGSVGGTFRFVFANGEALTVSELSALKFSGPLDFAGTDQAIRVTGSRYGDTIIGSTQNDLLEGGEGDDLLAGAGGRDTLLGGQGADLLVGNAGDDLLDGGAGADTYRLRPGTGQDTVFEQAGDLNTIALGTGLGAGHLDAQRREDDLYLYIRSSPDGIVIQDYFVPDSPEAAQDWQVGFADDTSMPLPELLEALEHPERPATIAALIDEFMTSTRGRLESALIANGYTRATDGELDRTTTHSEEWRDFTTVDFTLPTQLDDSPVITRSVEPVAELESTTTFAQVTHEVETLVTTGSTFVPHGAGGNLPGFGSAGSSRYVEIDGEQFSGVGYPTGGSVVTVHGSSLGVHPLTDTETPSIAGYRVFPDGVSPTYVTSVVTHAHRNDTHVRQVNILEITAGNSDNSIEAAEFATVDGGAGDDFLKAADDGALFRLTGDPSIGSPGVLLYGNSGNDVLQGGAFDDLLIGGAGVDLLEGGAGNDTYVVMTGDGIDEIIERGATGPGADRQNTLRLADSVTLAELQFSWSEALVAAPVESPHNFPDEQLTAQSLHAVLTIQFGAGDGARIVIPHEEHGAFTGIDFVELDNGRRVAFEDVLALAPEANLNPHRLANTLSGDGTVFGGDENDTVQAATAIGGAGRDILIAPAGGGELFGADAVRSRIGVFEGSGLVGSLLDEGNTYRGGGKYWATAGSDIFEIEAGEFGTVTDALHDDAYYGYGGFVDVYSASGEGGPELEEALLVNQDTLRFGSGISPQDISFVRTSRVSAYTGLSALDDLWIGPVRFENWYTVPLRIGKPHNQLSRIEFADGTVWNRATIDAMAAGLPHTVDGTGFDDFMFGLSEADLIQAGEGNDQLTGGQGDDVLDGGAGDDTYFFNPGDGIDTIRDSALDAFDVLAFGADAAPGTITPGSGSLVLRYGDQGDAIHFEGFDPDDPLGSGAIESLQLADGSSLSYGELLARGFDIHGTSGNEVLTGTAVQDRMTGSGGSDVLLAGSGDDTLDGGSGDDQLAGGSGNDTYLFASFSGADRIEDVGGDDVLRLGAGILPDTTTVLRFEDTLRLSFDGSRGAVSILWRPDLGHGVEQVEFIDGTRWDATTLEALAATVQNEPPVAVADSVAGTENTVTDNLVFVLLGNDVDEDAGDALRIASVETTGTAGTVAFDEASQVLTYEASAATHNALGQGATLTDSFVYRVSDIEGATASATVTVTIAGVNDAPAPVADAIAAGEGATTASLSAALLSNDIDVDLGDTVRISAVDGTGAAGVVSFDEDSREVTYTAAGPASDALAEGMTALDTFAYTVADAAGATAEATVTVTVTGVNDAPVSVSALADRTVNAGATFSYTLPAGAFADVDSGDVLTYVARRADGSELPDWLGFDPGTRKLSGAPSKSDLGTLSIRITATDPHHVSASDVFDLVVVASVISGTSGGDVLAGTVGDDTISGLAGNDTLNGDAGSDVLNGGSGNDKMNGGAGNDVLDGGSGNDKMNGGAGDDSYVIDGRGDTVTEGAGAGTDLVRSAVDHTLGSNVERLVLTGSAVKGGGNGSNNLIEGNSRDNILSGNVGNDILNGGSGKDALNGGSGNDTLNGGGGIDSMAGATGDDVYVVDNKSDVVTEKAGEGRDTVQAGINYLLGGTLENLLLTGTSALNGTGNAVDNSITGNSGSNALSGGNGNDIITGGAGADTLKGGAGNDFVNGGTGNDTLRGDAGNDVLEGMDGNDALADTGGNNYLAGFAGSDTLAGAAGNELFIGGAGNDTVTTAAGADVIAYNRGDGKDAVVASTGRDNTISLGLAIEYADLYFQRQANDLVLETGSGGQLTFRDWYAGNANQSVLNLQVIAGSMAGYDAGSADPLLDRKVQRFDFQALVDAFDQARSGDPGLDRWALMDGLLDAHLAGSDTEAIGGDLAYQYGLTGSLAGIGAAAAQGILAEAQFGSAPQALRPLAGLQQGGVRLS